MTVSANELDLKSSPRCDSLQSELPDIIFRPSTTIQQAAAIFTGTAHSGRYPQKGCGFFGQFAFCLSIQSNKAMLLRSDSEARIVQGHNGREPVQSSAGEGFGREQPQLITLTDEQLGIESPIHPLGIKPSGNKLLSTGTTDAREAIGAFQALPDGMATSVMNLASNYGLL